MTYSYTQISQYLTCPRRYRHRYLDGWKEKDTRAAMLFGRAFEQALGAYYVHDVHKDARLFPYNPVPTRPFSRNVLNGSTVRSFVPSSRISKP
jgi:PD-(D/E)XK nuclease superfamily